MNSNQLKWRFNLVGRFYNPVKRLVLGTTPEAVIGKTIKELETFHNVLVVGGGADNCVSELIQNQKSKKITLVDVSATLLEEAKVRIQNRNTSKVDIALINCAFLDFESTKKFDLVIFPFYLDLFSDQEVHQNIMHVSSKLNNMGKVLIIDFSSSKKQSFINQVKVALLYALFLPISGTFRLAIPNYYLLFSTFDFQLIRERTHASRLYNSQIFQYREV